MLQIDCAWGCESWLTPCLSVLAHPVLSWDHGAEGGSGGCAETQRSGRAPGTPDGQGTSRAGSCHPTEHQGVEYFRDLLIGLLGASASTCDGPQVTYANVCD